MNIHVVTPHPDRPRHATGEIVWATVGNYLEHRDARCKIRPAVILRAGCGQHWIAGLTTQAVCKMTGHARVIVPVNNVCGLCGSSYLWSTRPSRLSRIDVRSHLGWIDTAVLEVLREHMNLPWHIRTDLKAAVGQMTYTADALSAATL